MKKIFFFVLMISTASKAQTVKDIFSPQVPVIWLGLDFSKAKFIGDEQHFGDLENTKRLLKEWNNLMLRESDKYRVAKAIGRDSVINMIDFAHERNSKLDVESMLSEKTSDHIRLDLNEVRRIVADYSFGDLSGIGCMFIIESFNKTVLEGNILVTFINLNTKEVLFSERVSASPRGFGLRNYWAGAIYSVIKQMENGRFKAWKKKLKAS